MAFQDLMEKKASRENQESQVQEDLMEPSVSLERLETQACPDVLEMRVSQDDMELLDQKVNPASLAAWACPAFAV